MKYVPDASLPTMLAAEAVTRLTAGDDFAAQVSSTHLPYSVFVHLVRLQCECAAPD